MDSDPLLGGRCADEKIERQRVQIEKDLLLSEEASQSQDRQKREKKDRREKERAAKAAAGAEAAARVLVCTNRRK